MQRSSSRETTVAVVGVGTVTGGAVLAAGEGGLSVAPGLALPIVCLTAAALRVVRHYVTQQEQRIRDLFTKLARQHAERERELDRREADLARREESLQRAFFISELRVASAYSRMDMMLDELADQRLAHHALQTEYRELASEYNELVLDAAEASPTAEVHHSSVAVGQTGSAGSGAGGGGGAARRPAARPGGRRGWDTPPPRRRGGP
ncbi:hypothetical protein ABZ923_40470, partial [Streptomyces sp. NPDC046881]|uniref:hypothetical protein n=1 Tax=Streptomyces sp. NPDC046881 TaxID=3155374 RepID=UPI0033C2AE5D